MENLFSPTRATVAMASGEPGAPGFSGASTSAPKAREILAPPPSRVARGPEAAFAVEVLSMPCAAVVVGAAMVVGAGAEADVPEAVAGVVVAGVLLALATGVAAEGVATAADAVAVPFAFVPVTVVAGVAAGIA